MVMTGEARRKLTIEAMTSHGRDERIAWAMHALDLGAAPSPNLCSLALFSAERMPNLCRLLAQSGEVEFGVQRVGERHPVEYRPGVEILTQDHGHLPEAGDRPELGVVVTTLPAKAGTFSGKTRRNRPPYPPTAPSEPAKLARCSWPPERLDPQRTRNEGKRESWQRATSGRSRHTRSTAAR